MMTDQARAGLWAAASAYVLWGLLPLYLKAVGFASPWEVLAQRVLWSIPFALAAVLMFKVWRETWAAMKAPGALLWLTASAALISINWGVYVSAVANHQVIEASLAYFLTPIVQVAFGVLLFKERLAPLQAAALALAAAGVLVQGLALGAAPWVALVLCATWSTYGLIRKRLPIPAAGGLLVETALLALPALGMLMWLSTTPAGLAIDDGPGQGVLLALTGFATALPLILFAFGARRLQFTTIGLLQFIAPTLQFVTGVAYGEPFTPLRALSFGLIWTGLALFLAQTWRRSPVAA